MALKKEFVYVYVSCCEILFLVTNKNFLQFRCRILHFYDLKHLLKSEDFLFKFHDTFGKQIADWSSNSPFEWNGASKASIKSPLEWNNVL